MRRTLALLLALSSTLSCAGGEPAGAGLALRDPAGILDEVTVDRLRLLVFPSDARGCSAAEAGQTQPAITDPRATFAEAVVDIDFTAGSTRSQVDLLAGTYTVAVLLFGDDDVFMLSDALLAHGCTTGVTIAAGETRMIAVELARIMLAGMCGDGRLSPDEQCEADSPAPCSMCRTQPYDVSTTGGVMEVSAGFSTGGRLVVSYDDTTNSPRGVRLMVHDESGQRISSPTALTLDSPVDDGATISGVQSVSDAASSPSRVGVAFGDFANAATEGGDVQVRFFDRDRNPAGPPVLATAAQTGAQTEPSIGMMPDGAALVAFTDAVSATGLGGRVFAAGSATPSGAATLELGTGSAGASAPDVAGHGTGFVVAYATAAGVHFQRLDATGAPVDAAGVMVAASADQPAVAALSDGRFLVAWRDTGSGRVRGRAYTAAGAPAVDAFDVSAAAGAEPSVGATNERFGVAWLSGSEARARLFSGDGNPAFNREPTPSSGEFLVATGAERAVAVAGGPAGQAMLAIVWQAGGTARARLFPLP